MNEHPDKQTEHHRLKARLIEAVIVALIGAAVTLPALRLVPAVYRSFGAGTLSASAGLGSGRTVVTIPPLGTISANTHTSALELSLALASIDPEKLGDEVLSDDGRKKLARRVEDDLRTMAFRLALQLLAAGVIVGAVAGAVLPRRKWSHPVAGAAGGIVAVGIVLALTAMTFDAGAFREPRFTGALVRAPQILRAIDKTPQTLEQLQSRYRVTATRLTDLLAVVARPNPNPHVGTVSVLHISDVHSNPLGLELARQLARAFDVDAVVDTGDITSFGAPVESRIGHLIADFPAPYYFVPGNHDSPANRRALAGATNVTLVDKKVVDIHGLRLLGWPDPTFTADDRITTEAGNRINEEDAPEVARAVAATRPDVLAVHNPLIAQDSFGEVPLILSGHTHQEAIESRDGTLLLTVGSTGATGLGSFTVESQTDYEAEIIYFRSDRAVALDYVRLEGIGNDFEIERHTFDDGGLAAGGGAEFGWCLATGKHRCAQR